MLPEDVVALYRADQLIRVGWIGRSSRVKHRHEHKDVKTERIGDKYISHVAIAEYEARQAEQDFLHRVQLPNSTGLLLCN